MHVYFALLAAIGASNALSHEPFPVRNRITTQNINRPNVKLFTEMNTETVALPLDHWNASAGTFLNRFWVYDNKYQTGGPVILWDAGEGNAIEDVESADAEKSVFKQMLNEVKGIGVIWEHRYYGESVPDSFKEFTNRPSHQRTNWPPAESYRYLTTEQALADVPAFAWNFSRPRFPNQDLTPASTPWVFVGGSYPGMRAAFIREIYPETIFASYAASAPVQASVDMSFYWEPVWQGMRAAGFVNCSNDIHSAILSMDKTMEDPSQSLALKQMFLGEEIANSTTNEDFAYTLAQSLGNWQGGGVNGGLGALCNHLSTDPITNMTSDEKGWAHVKGANYTIQRWASFDKYDYGTGPTMLKFRSAFDQDSLDSRSWTWQFCTEWGFLQSANLGEHQLVSKFNSLEYNIESCHVIFADGYASGLLPERPQTEETNARYGGWNIRPTNTYWTAGQFDPWMTLSPFSTLKSGPKLTAIQSISECSSALPDNSNIFGMLIPDAEHCSEFDFDKAANVRELFYRALKQWLDCFKKKKNNFYKGATNIRRVVYT